MAAIDPAEDGDFVETLLAVQRAAYQVEASLIDDDRIPALHEDVVELRAAPLRWLGAFDDDGRLIGAVAWSDDANEVDIDRLVVDPAAHRCGAGRELVQAVLSCGGAAARSSQPDGVTCPRACFSSGWGSGRWRTSGWCRASG